MSSLYAFLPLTILNKPTFTYLVRKHRPEEVTLVRFVVLKGLSKNKLFMLEKKKDNLYLLIVIKDNLKYRYKSLNHILP